MLERAWVRWLVILGLWTALGLFFATQAGMTYMYSQGSAPWGLIVKLSLSEWYIWAALTPVVLWLARRFPLERGCWRRSLLMHVPASLFFTVMKIAIEDQVRGRLLSIPGHINPMNKMHLAFLTYWGIVGVRHAFAHYRKYRERELAAAQLETQLAQAQMQALQMQIHPHFLFNTLHAISALMHKDVEAADRMITRLSDLLRITLDNAGRQEITLRQEMEFAGRYLEIQQIRFQDRLVVRTEIEPETLDACVPNLLLQPLVENAIRHGIAPRAKGGRLEILARREGNRLCIEVRDDGPGLPSGPGFQEGVGLTNTRARLARLYGNEYCFELTGTGARGVCVRIEIPFRPAAEPQAVRGNGK